MPFSCVSAVLGELGHALPPCGDGAEYIQLDRRAQHLGALIGKGCIEEQIGRRCVGRAGHARALQFGY
jgi:hypothetical protein